MVDNVSVNDEVLEPVVGQGVVRSMSDVLRVNTSIDELEYALLDRLDDETALRDSSPTHSETLMGYSSTLLLRHLL
jgi:hypothetical protein